MNLSTDANSRTDTKTDRNQQKAQLFSQDLFPEEPFCNQLIGLARNMSIKSFKAKMKKRHGQRDYISPVGQFS